MRLAALALDVPARCYSVSKLMLDAWNTPATFRSHTAGHTGCGQGCCLRLRRVSCKVEQLRVHCML